MYNILKGNEIALNYSSIKKKELLKGYPERLIYKKLKISSFCLFLLILWQDHFKKYFQFSKKKKN